MSDKCVHTEHCCSKHGCKYGNPDCPVELGIKKQSFACECCIEEREYLLHLIPEGYVLVPDSSKGLDDGYFERLVDAEHEVCVKRGYPIADKLSHLEQYDTVIKAAQQEGE